MSRVSWFHGFRGVNGFIASWFHGFIDFVVSTNSVKYSFLIRIYCKPLNVNC